MDRDKSVIGNFVEREYSINYTINGSGTVDETVIQSKSEYKVGTLVQLTPIPSDGWKFVEWGGELNTTEQVIEVTIDGETNITVTFERIDYPLTITIEGEGEVEQRIIQAKTTEYPFETILELTPVPSDGWEFISWSGDVESTEEVIQVTIDGEINISVKFESLFFLHSNGVTIMCPNTSPGDIGAVNGVEYESVDRELLIQRRDEGKDLTKVCVSLVTDLRRMFERRNFNQTIGNWDVSNVSLMNYIFDNSSFNQSIENWNVKNVTQMSQMFSQSPFNQPIDNWDVGNVTDMSGIFSSTPFNQPISKWDVSNVTDMSRMFSGSPFNQPIANWNVGNVTSMNAMFLESQFNQHIGVWDVSNVLNMDLMFFGNPFNKDISGWCVTNIWREPDGFSTFLNPEYQPIWGTCPD